ncbi:MAG: ABC transporter ATP-binding protein [Aquabacterium sp.]
MFRRFENLIDAFPAAPPRRPPARLLPFMWACTQGLRPAIAGMMLLAATIGAFEALLFSFLGRIVDWLAAVPPAELFTRHGHTLALLGGVLAGSIGLVLVWALLKHQAMAGSFPMRLRWNFHRLMLGQSLAFFQDEFAGRIATKLMQTALAVRDAVNITGDILVYVLVYFLTLNLVVGAFDTRLLLPFVAWLVLYVAAMFVFVPRLAKISEQQADARALMTGRITDAYTNITTVKLFSHANREAGFAREAMGEFLGTVHRQFRLVTGVEMTTYVLSVLLIGGSTGATLWLWSRGEVGVGAVAAITAMALRLNGISHWIMWEMASLFEHIGTATDGMATLSRERRVVDRADAPALAVTRGELHFDQVGFAYATDRPEVIRDFSLTIAAGEKIGLVGRSGAGKSTLVNLLLRFHDLQRGCIRIDGQDIAGVAQESLRAAIGMVTQDTSLLHRSVRDNILYGRPDAGDTAMIQAAQRAEAHEFILGLSDAKGREGYDAHVGERGVKLSGGQRQRVAIARVMLKDAPILLLDEATSALDSEVEQAIQASLYKLMQGKTVVAIAHRLSTIAAMDRLIVMDGGAIVEQGRHDELLAAGGLYARLWSHQSGGFLGEE